MHEYEFIFIGGPLDKKRMVFPVRNRLGYAVADRDANDIFRKVDYTQHEFIVETRYGFITFYAYFLSGYKPTRFDIEFIAQAYGIEVCPRRIPVPAF